MTTTTTKTDTVAHLIAARAQMLTDGGVEKGIGRYVRAIVLEELEIARVECRLSPDTGRFEIRVDVFACIGLRQEEAGDYVFALAEAFSVAEAWRELTSAIALTEEERAGLEHATAWLAAFGAN